MRRFVSPTALRWSDLVLGLLLGTATLFYLATYPLNVLTPPDEAHALHQAKRLLRGEVLYRDLFDLATPLWTYLMAGLFWLFGTTLATARLTVAVIHGLTVLGIFLVCRRLSVRRVLAVAAAAGQVIVCQPAYPVANRHWLVTLMCVLLLWCLSSRRNAAKSGVAGAIVGLLIATHQQRGLSMGAGVLVFLVVEVLLWGDTEHRARLLATRVAAFAGGVLVVVGVTLAVVVGSAGIGPVWYALVVHPLTRYHGVLSAKWAQGARSITFPMLLRYLPVVPVLCAFRLLLAVWRGSNPERARWLALLMILLTFSIVSIWYYPDAVHVAFIAPLFFVAIAEGLEWLLRWLPHRLSVATAWIVAATVLVGGGSRPADRWRWERSVYRITRMTGFGRIDVDVKYAELYDRQAEALRAVPSRTLYVHPISSFFYLLHDARNPTRFEFVHAGSYNTQEQVEEVLAVLARGEVEYVFFPLGRLHPADPIVQFVRRHYSPPRDEGLVGDRLWRRNPQATAPSTAPML